MSNILKQHHRSHSGQDTIWTNTVVMHLYCRTPNFLPSAYRIKLLSMWNPATNHFTPCYMQDASLGKVITAPQREVWSLITMLTPPLMWQDHGLLPVLACVTALIKWDQCKLLRFLSHYPKFNSGSHLQTGPVEQKRKDW